jgi:replication fork clamp-binding protein CrfC
VVFRVVFSRDGSIFASGCARMIEDEQSEWRQLCERASTEQDFQKLLELTNEILRLTEPKRKRFQAPPDHDDC